MRKTYRLENLDCAHCATKMEDKINKLPGVEEAIVNFMAGKMILQAAEQDMPQVIEEAIKIINKLEPQVVVHAV